MIARPKTSFWYQLGIQRRVIWALVMREMITRFGREGLGVLWLVGEPAMFIVGVMIIFSLVDQAHGGISVAEYLAVSYPTIILWRNTTGRVAKALEANAALLHLNPIRPVDLFYSRIVLEFSGAIASFLILYLVFVAIGICQWPDNVLLMTFGYFMVAWFSFGFVLIMGALSELSETIDRVSHIILYLMLPFSGIFMPAHLVPDQYRDLLLLTPLINTVEMFHAGYFGDRMVTYYSIPYTMSINLLMTFAGLLLVNIAIRRVKL
ncbi:ABC transporter permease [Sulfuriferula nivalis]|uniref:Transport permease protein n=1 Tax=Sulfuriferula nivalis TaxID=2675298 RepID=A0A809RIV2_9PROT|nr:ABC transporter permease [Sulfuriferula nivalis]BBP00764.1 transport permease protein [Sulfuriferula nivalis]